MKNQPFILILVTLILGCDHTEVTSLHPENQTLKDADVFKPLFFSDDHRVDSIRNAAPQIYEIFKGHLSTHKIPGLAYGIVVDDELVVSSAIGLANIGDSLAASVTTDFRIASMSKSFTATAIVKLRDEGKLSLADPASKYIPEMANLTYLTEDAPPVDIQNLLTMTAGFPEDNPWGDRQLDESDQMLLDFMAEGVSFSNVPAYAFEYSNTGYALLGLIISNVSGMPYQEYIQKNILQPLGMDHTYWEYSEIPADQFALGYRWEDEQWKLEPVLHDGSYGAMGGLITTIEDFSKYVSFHLSAWPPRNGEDSGPVKRSSLREMHTPQFNRLLSKAEDWNGDPCAMISGYGYGLGISEDCRGINRVRHGGALPGFGSQYLFYPEYGIGVMSFGNLTYTSPLPTAEIEKMFFETLDLPLRQLPVSNILLERKEEVAQLIQDWGEGKEEILAENFYLDHSREHWIADINKLWSEAGEFQSVGDIEPFNQLRGEFKLETTNGFINTFFTLTPEKDPKVQQLYVSFEAEQDL